MSFPRAAVVPLLLALASGCATAQQQRDTGPAATRAGAQAPAGIGTGRYDVLLEVPELSVDSIGLRVADLNATLSLDANVINLVTLNAGADVFIERVRLDLTGVHAEAYVYVDLDNVARIADRVLATLDRNPQILTQLLSAVDTVVGTVGGVANTALQPSGVVGQTVGVLGQTLDQTTRPGGLLSQTVNTLGQTVQRTIGQTGNILERTVDATGQLVSERSVGNLLDQQNLRVLREATNAAGQTVRQVQDQAGAVIEYTLDRAGGIASARVLREAPQQRR